MPPINDFLGSGIGGTISYVGGSGNDVVIQLDTSVYDFAAATFDTTEGDNTNTTTVVTVNRSAVTTTQTSVDVVLSGGSAVAGTDYNAGPIRVTFAAGETSKAVDIELLGDLVVEADQTLGLSLTNFTDGGSAGSTQPTATLNIADDDTSNASFNAPSVTEGGDLVFDVTLSQTVDADVVLTYSTSDGTATTNDADYTGVTSQTLTIPAGQTSGSITIGTSGDDNVELDETLILDIESITASGLDVTSDTDATGTILNDDAATVTLGNPSVTEGSDLVFNVTLNKVVDADTVITYSTVDGTATTANSDYTGQTDRTVTIPAGQTGGTITVATTTDDNVELDETLTVGGYHERGRDRSRCIRSREPGRFGRDRQRRQCSGFNHRR